MLSGIRRQKISSNERGQPFSNRERRSLFAHCVYFIAYGARCSHSLTPQKVEWEPDTWPYLLRDDGEALLKV
jgi:hypothetical protein